MGLTESDCAADDCMTCDHNRWLSELEADQPDRLPCPRRQTVTAPA